MKIYCVACNLAISPDQRKRKYNGSYYCDRHYRQMLKYGKIIITKFDPNEIVKYDTYAEVILLDINKEEWARALIDLDDIEKIIAFKWHYDGYATSRLNNKIIHMHNVICGFMTDHINRDTLDNRKINLRPINKIKNMYNSNISIRNSSGVKGVSWDKSRDRWSAYIQYDKQYINIGRYSNFDDAVMDRMIYETKYFGIYSACYNQKTKLIELTYTSRNVEKTIKLNLKGEVIDDLSNKLYNR